MNIGCVSYTKIFSSGELIANWSFDDGKNIMEGTGQATGEINNDYSGDYQITYFDNKGNNLGIYNLTIVKSENSYILKWYQDNTIKFTGLAFLVNSILVGGWKPVM